jgi:hypothetical protein
VVVASDIQHKTFVFTVSEIKQIAHFLQKHNIFFSNKKIQNVVVSKHCVYITDLNCFEFSILSEKSLLVALEVCGTGCWLAGMHILVITHLHSVSA